MWPFKRKPKCPVCKKKLGDKVAEIVVRHGGDPITGEALLTFVTICADCADKMEADNISPTMHGDL
jgi:hypothetical protein